MRVTLLADGTPGGTRLLTEDGNPLKITGVRFEQRAHGLPVLEADIVLSSAGLTGDVRPFFNGREVAKVVFADGGEELF